MEEFNEQTQRAKVAAGYKGGPFYKSPMQHPKMTFVDAVPPEVRAKQMASATPKMNVETPWFSRK